MKQVTNGHMYDTETAVKITTYCNRLSEGNLNNRCEVLYKTNEGDYFLYGSETVMSKYLDGDYFQYGPEIEISKYFEENSKYLCDSEMIVPLTPEDTFEWLDEKNKYEEILENFQYLLIEED